MISFEERPSLIKNNNTLRHYAIFKARRCESLFYKINTCLQKTTTSISLQVEQICSVNIWNIHFFNFGRGFCGFFSTLSSEDPGSSYKKIWNNFYCIVLLFVKTQKVSLKVLQSYFKLEILIFIYYLYILIFWQKNSGEIWNTL